MEFKSSKIIEKGINFEANMSHGTLLRPFAQYRTDIGEVLPFYPIHWHKEMEIIRVQDGVGSFCINGEIYNASKGDIIFIGPYANHSIQRFANASMTIDAILFNVEMLIASIPDICSLLYLTPLLKGEHTAPVILRPSNKLYPSFDQSLTTIMYSLPAEERGYELSIKANLFWLLYHLYKNNLIRTDKSGSENKSHQTIKAALDYIRKNFAKDFSIADLAVECGYSETYLMKLFKKYTGITCIDYINNYRMNKAGEMLISGNEQIIDVAFSCGYSNISYFNKLFKEAYEMTPKEFRRQNGI